MIKTSKRAYPDGKVPADFKNWFKKIKNHNRPLLKRSLIKYVESFPFRKGINYETRLTTVIDKNYKVIKINKLIRIV